MIISGLAQGFAGFALYAGAVMLLLRLRFEPTALVMAAVPGAWLTALAVLLATGHGVDFWVFSTSYCFFVLCFLMVFGAIYKSISLRILLHLLCQPGRTDSYAALSRSILGESYRQRLTIMEEKGYAIRTGGVFILTERGKRIARWAASIQSAFGIARSG